MIHYLYIKKGKYNILHFIPYTLISFVVSHFFTIIIKYIFLSQRIIKNFKMLRKYSEARDIYYSIPRTIIRKYICFFIVIIIFNIIFWYFVSIFGAVFQNSQIALLKNTLFSFGFSFIYPFLIYLLPSFIRIHSLSNKEKNSRCTYNLSKFLQSL